MGVEQPQSAIQGGNHRAAWVREGFGSEAAEIDRQDLELAAWSLREGWLIGQATLLELAALATAQAQGNEHDVLAFTTGVAPFVIRLTKRDMFGMPGRTPGEYLQRWRLSNALFPAAAASFAGYAVNVRGNGIILTAQPLIEGIRKRPKAIAAAFQERDFFPIPGSPHAFRHPGSGIEIYDAHEGNVIFQRDGGILPIDVWVNDPFDSLGCGTSG